MLAELVVVLLVDVFRRRWWMRPAVLKFWSYRDTLEPIGLRLHFAHDASTNSTLRTADGESDR